MELLLLVWITANTADIVTTEGAIRAGIAREANPLLRHTAVRVPLKVGITAGGVVAIKKLHKKRPKLVTTCVIVASSIYATAAVHNYRVWRKK